MFNPILHYEYGLKKTVNSFVSFWNTKNVSIGSSEYNQIRLPLINTGTYNFTVDWGDGNKNQINSWDEAVHTYNNSGAVKNYIITITGICSGWAFNNTGDRLKLIAITSWGCLNPKSNIGSQFSGCSNLDLKDVTDVLNLTGVTNCDAFFNECISITTINKINQWNVSSVTTMYLMFNQCESFNQDLNNWNVENVNDMSYMFTYCTNFNGNISNWNVLNVTNMNAMFGGCTNFNQDLFNWNVIHVKNMSAMFAYCTNFNQSLSEWNVGSVTDMSNMFAYCTNFNENIIYWDTSQVTKMYGMFENASSFNQELNWVTTNVKLMQNMFLGATAFNNISIANWNLVNVQDLTDFMGDKTPLTLSTDVLSEIYYRWSLLKFETENLNISFGSAKYFSFATQYKNVLTSNPYNFNITDGGSI